MESATSQSGPASHLEYGTHRAASVGRRSGGGQRERMSYGVGSDSRTSHY